MKDDKDNVQLSAVEDHNGILRFVGAVLAEVGMAFIINKGCPLKM